MKKVSEKSKKNDAGNTCVDNSAGGGDRGSRGCSSQETCADNLGSNLATVEILSLQAARRKSWKKPVSLLTMTSSMFRTANERAKRQVRRPRKRVKYWNQHRPLVTAAATSEERRSVSEKQFDEASGWWPAGGKTAKDSDNRWGYSELRRRKR